MGLTLDSKRSSIRIRTFAEGLFSRLAHDLELVCRDVSGTGSFEDGSCTLRVPVRSIDVVGTLKHGTVDSGALSPSEREDILGKMRREVFHDGDIVTVEAKMGEPVKVSSPKGKTAEGSARHVSSKDPDGCVHVKGQLELSLNALGSDPVKGPMNAFRVKDNVEVHFDVVFQPA